MKVELLKYPTAKDWEFVKRCALVTIGKTLVNPPEDKWKRSMLIARHSPIRELQFAFLLTDIPYWVSVHLCRHHIGCQPYVKTQRNDRQNEYDRNEAPQNAPVDMIWTMNADALLNIAEKRLCNLAAQETRKVVSAMCCLVVDACPEFYGVFMPKCRNDHMSCPEINPCFEWVNKEE